MQKPKRKNPLPPSDAKVFTVLAIGFFLVLSLCGIYWILTTFLGFGMAGNFKHFETADEVVAFLYENLEADGSTSDDVQLFMSDYDSRSSCGSPYNSYSLSGLPRFIECDAPIARDTRRIGFQYYWIRFYFNEDNTLREIEVSKICSCP